MKTVLLALTALLVTNLISYAQLAKGDCVLNFSGSYIESSGGTGVPMSNLDIKNRTLDLGFKIGQVVSKSFIVGLGFEYAHSNEDLSYFTYDQTSVRVQSENIKSHAILPELYLKYYKPFFTKFQFALNLSVGYGVLSSQYNTLTAISTPLVNPGNVVIVYGPSGSGLSESEYSRNINILSIALEPEIHYFVTEKLGAMVQFGGASYTLYGSEDHNWTVSLNPSYWTYGFFLRFGKKNN